MKRITLLASALAASAFLAACGAPAGNAPVATNANSTNTNTNTNTAKPVAAAPTKEALMTLEKGGWEAWKNRDTKWSEENYSAKGVGFGKDGRQDKAAMIKAMTEAKCDIKSYSLSDDQMTMLGADVAVLTFKGTQDGTCDGKKVPAAVWASSVYVRESDKWKALLYVENPVVDPAAPPAKATAPVPAKKDAAKPTDAKPDSLSDSLMAIETKAWEAWKQRDKAGVEAVMTKDFFYVSGLGRKDRAGAIALWAESKCTGLDYKFSDPMGMSITPDVSLVTYRADTKGTCDGKPVPPHLWVASFDMKEGDAWKNAFYTDVNQ
ncbi:MAG: nuclear transport factor 2 family protein [Pyrinomonadaceae bacterium]